jgi:hypothetical protein
MFKTKIFNSKFKYGNIDKIQSSFVEVSLYNESKIIKLHIDFLDKREFNLKLNYKFKSMDLDNFHILNIETRENFYEIYFSTKSYTSFKILIDSYKDLINNSYYPYKNYKSFINNYFTEKNMKFDFQIFGKLGVIPESLLKVIENINNENISISKFLLSRKWEDNGKVLTLDKYFVWCKDFKTILI